MKKLVWVVIAGIVIVMAVTIFSPQDESSYRAKIEEQIAAQQRYLEHNPDSPFNVFDVSYQTPSYFEIDPTYRVTARVERIVERTLTPIQSSDGTMSQYVRHAWLHFELKGVQQRLLVLRSASPTEDNYFFLGFADETSGRSTYGGGRYLDIDLGKSPKVTLDFNLAYNPYCAYVEDYSCPLPPPENVLPVEIRAGEKDFKSDM